MKTVLYEEWGKITIEAINNEIEKLHIVSRFFSVSGGNNFHA